MGKIGVSNARSASAASRPGAERWRGSDLRLGWRRSGGPVLLAGLMAFGVVIGLTAIQLAVPLGCGALVAACYLQGRRAPALFGNLLVDFLGASSFSAYLDHLLITVAPLTWRFIERPRRELGRRLRHHLERRSALQNPHASRADLASTGAP